MIHARIAAVSVVIAVAACGSSDPDPPSTAKDAGRDAGLPSSATAQGFFEGYGTPGRFAGPGDPGPFAGHGNPNAAAGYGDPGPYAIRPNDGTASDAAIRDGGTTGQNSGTGSSSSSADEAAAEIRRCRACEDRCQATRTMMLLTCQNLRGVAAPMCSIAVENEYRSCVSRCGGAC